MDVPKRILVTGGVKSGKSRFALDWAHRFEGEKTMIATAVAFDDQMQSKIQKHQQERGNDFKTIEEPVYLAQSIKRAQTNSAVVLVDCTTMWLNNLTHRFGDSLDDIENQIEEFLKVLSHAATNIIIITNEIGLGVMPDNALARRYTDELGCLNQRMASISDEVIMMISGIPQWVKGVGVYERMDQKV